MIILTCFGAPVIRTPPKRPLAFPPHITRGAVFLECNETRMPQMVVRRPFDILELPHQDGFQPAALLQLVSGSLYPRATRPLLMSRNGLRDGWVWFMTMKAIAIGARWDDVRLAGRETDDQASIKGAPGSRCRTGCVLRVARKMNVWSEICVNYRVGRFVRV